jgi:uncharacterized protein (DUF58 family)
MLSPDLIRTIRRIEIRTRHLVNDSFAGEYHAIFKGRGMDFDDVRPYQPGDQVRSIDWNVTARMGTPFIKRYVEERELTVILAVDASASGRFGTAGRFKREIGAELAAVLAFSAISNNDKVGLLIFTDRVELHIPPRRGRRHVLRLIRDLLAFEPASRGTDIALALARLNRVLKRRAIIFLLSDFLLDYETYQRDLVITNRRHDVVAVTLTDPREMTWPAVGLVSLEDPETGAKTWIDTANDSWRDAFAQETASGRSARNAALTQAKVDRIDVIVGQDYVAPLSAFFRTRARRLRR